MVATKGEPLLQTPPGVIFDKAVVNDGQIELAPVIGLTAANGFTVKVPALVTLAAGFVTVMNPVVAKAGNVAVICVGLLTIKPALTPSNETLVVPVR